MTLRKASRFAAATRGLAGVIAGALLLFELLAANGEFHQALHHNGNAASNSCVLCLFAKGHLDLPQPIPVPGASAQSAFDSAPRGESIAMAHVPYLAFPSRAPPGISSPLSVVG